MATPRVRKLEEAQAISHPVRIRMGRKRESRRTAPLLDITTVCTARCIYCFHQYKKLAPKKHMERCVFQGIVDILRREGFRFIHLYMSGEPIYHPEFYDFLEIITQAGIAVDIASKLPAPLDFEKLKFVLEKSPVRVSWLLTVDGATQDVLSKVAAGLRVNTVVANLEGLRRLYELPFGMGVRASTVVNAFNVKSLSSIRILMRRVGIPWEPKCMGSMSGNLATSEDIEHLGSIAAGGKFKPSRFKVVDGCIVPNNKKCQMLKPAISVDGNVSICCHDTLFQVNAGNVLEAGSLRNILNSEKYKRLRKAGTNRTLPICNNCS